MFIKFTIYYSCCMFLKHFTKYKFKNTKNITAAKMIVMIKFP